MMKNLTFFLALFLCLAEPAFAGMLDSNLERKIAYDGKETIVAITPGGPSKRTNPEYVLHYSKDYGKTWQRMDEGGSNPSDPTCVKWQNDPRGKSDDSLNTIHYLGNEKSGYKFYAVGSSMRICSSSTGTDGWKPTPANLLFADISHNLRDITVGGSAWVAVGRDGAIYRSEDPEKMGWCNNDGRRPKDTMGWCAKFSDRHYDFTRVVYGNHPKYGPGFVAIAPWHPVIWHSTDGREWQEIDLSGKDQVRNGLVKATGSFDNLQYVPGKNMFVMVDSGELAEKMQPMVLSSEDGINWRQGLGTNDMLHLFNDIVYDQGSDTFIAAGSRYVSPTSFDSGMERSKDAVHWTRVEDRSSSFTISSLIYSAKSKRIIGTTLRPFIDTTLKFIPSGIATMSSGGEWVQARMHYTGDCASQHPNEPGELSKPIVITDPMGNEHFIATPGIPGGCAYWATDPGHWYASSYNGWR